MSIKLDPQFDSMVEHLFCGFHMCLLSKIVNSQILLTFMMNSILIKGVCICINLFKCLYM